LLLGLYMLIFEGDTIKFECTHKMYKDNKKKGRIKFCPFK